MKNKIFVFFFITALIIGFYNIKADAAVWVTFNDCTCVFAYKYGGSYYLCMGKDSDNIITSYANGSSFTFSVYGRFSRLNYGWSSVIDAVNYYNSHLSESVGLNNSVVTFSDNYEYPCVVIRGEITGVYPPQLDPEPEPDPTWWEILWSDFCDFVDEFLPDLATPGNPASLVHLAEWLQDSFTVKVGEGEDDLAMQILVSPIPTPTPTPTPIPYQTVMTPDGTGGFTINYVYNNPSGTPIITSQPPQQNVNIDVDNSFEYPYYENPENKDNPFRFKIPWYLKLVLKNNDIDIDTLDSTYQTAQGLVQNDQVVEAVDEVSNGFQVIPVNWLLILGSIASLPLFAALIHRFLGG